MSAREFCAIIVKCKLQLVFHNEKPLCSRSNGQGRRVLYTGSVKKVLVRLCSVTLLTQDKLATDPKMFVCAFADVIQRAQGLQNGQTWRRCSNHLFVQWPFYLCYFS